MKDEDWDEIERLCAVRNLLTDKADRRPITRDETRLADALKWFFREHEQ